MTCKNKRKRRKKCVVVKGRKTQERERERGTNNYGIVGREGGNEKKKTGGRKSTELELYQSR